MCRTTGGAGGTVTTVSTLPEFTAAVNEKNSAPAIVVVKGIISGDTKVRIGSNKSIIGLPGSGRFNWSFDDNCYRLPYHYCLHQAAH
jgi:pectate lyase